MDVIDEMNRLNRLHNLIRFETTGSTVELAEKMDISERTAYRLIALLKDMGCPIYFNNHKNSYCYEYPIKLILFKIEELDSKELISIIGENVDVFSQTANFWQSDRVSLKHCWETGANAYNILNFRQVGSQHFFA